MRPAKCIDEDYIQFLIATPKNCSCVEAARVQELKPDRAHHDSLTRLLKRIEPSSDHLWEEMKPLVEKGSGTLVLDDSTLDKPYSQKMDLVHYGWSGKHKKVVKGINLISAVWSDGDQIVPCDYRVYQKDENGLTKNDHFRSMVNTAHERGVNPSYLLFDSWYSGLENLKTIRNVGWQWLTRLKSNRLVSVNHEKKKAVSRQNISPSGTIVHLKGYGLIKVFKVVSKNGDIGYWATNNLEMNDLEMAKYADISWSIEEYHRGLKQFCGVERCQSRSAIAQKNHIGLSIRAFLRLAHYCFKTGMSWFDAKSDIIRNAVRGYLSNPK